MDLHDLKVLALDRYESDFQKPTDLELHCLQRRGWGGGGGGGAYPGPAGPGLKYCCLINALKTSMNSRKLK